MILVRACLLLATVSIASAQVPAMFPWWEAPIARDIGLTDPQISQIQSIVREWRPQLTQLRADVQAAERELKDSMNSEQVDTRRADAAIEKVAASRADLTRAVSRMSLRLRLLLTASQWQELQRRSANRPMFPGRQLRGRRGTDSPPQ